MASFPYLKLQLSSKVCGLIIQHMSAANKSSGGENRWLEQWSRNSFSTSSNLSHIPHPKDFDKDALSSTEDLNLLICRHSPSLILGKGSAIPLESGCIFFKKRSFGLSITPVLLNVMN